MFDAAGLTTSLTNVLDRGTRRFWRTAGRPVDLAGDHAWLAAPWHTDVTIGQEWLTAAAAQIGGQVRDDVAGAGLLPDMSVLDGPGFIAAQLDSRVRSFYEHTSEWRMEVWTQWNPLFQPGGEVVSRLFGRRVQQLALPTRPLDVAHGMDSRVAVIAAADGTQHAAGWLRTLRATGEYVYSGCYSTRTLPGARRPSVHVAFPLQDGNVQVFLRPDVLPGGGLQLTSDGGRFGGDGAYVVVRPGHAAQVPVREQFQVYVDADGVLRTDHVLRMWSATAVRLHYKLTPAD